jgi:thiol-disulfide isomerase/thioredoxin
MVLKDFERAFTAAFLLVAQPMVHKTFGQETAGIGVVLGMDGKYLMVKNILPDSVAAWNHSIQVGDRIIAVAQENMAPVQVEGFKIEEAVRLIRGPKGTTVRLTIVPHGKEESQARAVSFVRGELKELSKWGDGATLSIGTEAPNIQMTWLPGKTIDHLTNYSGKVVILEFWATWCAPCQKAMADLLSYPDKYPDWKDRVVLITVSVDDNDDVVVRNLEEKGWDKIHNVRVGIDAIKAYHVNRVPTIYIIDQRGKIAAADYVGEIPDIVNRLIHEKKAAAVDLRVGANQDGPSVQDLNEIPGSAGVLRASGRVLDGTGKPLKAASVFLREWACLRASETPERSEARLKGEGFPDILARTSTDVEGRFRFVNVVAPPFPRNPGVGLFICPWDLVVLAQGKGLVWICLTPENQERESILRLPPEFILRGQILQPSGNPVRGVRLKVVEISKPGEPLQRYGSTPGRLDLQWSSIPIATTSDAEGRFEILGLPPDVRIAVVALAPGYQRTVFYAATTAHPQPDLVERPVREGREEVQRIPVHTGELRITMAPADHRLLAHVLFDATGSPVPGADVFVGYQEIGKTDPDGRIEIKDLAAGTIELHLRAHDSDAVPLDLEVEIPAGEKVIERTFKLQKGLVISGRVIDSGTGNGIAGVHLRYRSQDVSTGIPTLFLISATSGSEGGFRLAVPGGRGKVEVDEIPPGYIRPPQRSTTAGQEGQSSRDVEGKQGESIEGLTFRLAPSRRVGFRVVEPDGQPVQGAEIRRLSSPRGGKEPLRTDAEGSAVQIGIDPEATSVFQFVHSQKRLGRLIEVGPIAEQETTDRPVEVVLLPLASVVGSLRDEQGKPLAGLVFLLSSESMTQGGILSQPVDRKSVTTSDGSFLFDLLVPDCSYSIEAQAEGHAGATSEHFMATSGSRHYLPWFLLPLADREVRGEVVDQGGKPVVGAVVSIEQNQSPINTTTLSGRWIQKTDEMGRFYLTKLPRGTFTIVVDRKTQGSEGSPPKPVRVRLGAGQTEVRIDVSRPLDGFEK